MIKDLMDMMGRRRAGGRLWRMLAVLAAAVAAAILLLQGCKGPKAGTVYGPADSEENL